MQSWLALSAVCVAALVGWVLADVPTSDASLVRAQRNPWQLLELPRRPELTVEAGRVSSAAFWGAPEPIAAAVAPPADTRWRVAAIFGAGKDRRLLVIFRDETRANAVVRVGEKLPDGNVVVEIGEKDYFASIDKRKVRFGVEKREES